MKKEKASFIEPTVKCLYFCAEYHQNCCLVHERDPKKCKRPIPFSVCCPACREEIKGMRKYYVDIYKKFTCKSCGQNYSITWQDEDISRN